MRGPQLEAAKLCVYLRFARRNLRHRLTLLFFLSQDPVFFASQCGGTGGEVPSVPAASMQNAIDRRLSTLAAAVEFAKANNLLGVLVEAQLLVRSQPNLF